MSVPTLTFFNNKGGVGKTTLVYHLSTMMARLGVRVVAADYDPQANLTSAFLEDATILDFLDSTEEVLTIYQALRRLTDGSGDILPLRAFAEFDDPLALIPGDLRLSGFEQQLADDWSNNFQGASRTRALRTTSALWRVTQQVARDFKADLILMDVGPNLGAINRALLIASDYVIFPVALDLFSLQGLRNVGTTLARWRGEWGDVLIREIPSERDFDIPTGKMQPLGYIILQHNERRGRIVSSYAECASRIPDIYQRDILNGNDSAPQPGESQLIGRVRHYLSLMSMAYMARKPIFDLRAADGAIGAHFKNVQLAHENFQELAESILQCIGIKLPEY